MALASQIHQNVPYTCFSLPVNDFVTLSIVFFYIWIALFSRCLWITSAFFAVRFNVRGIKCSDNHRSARKFTQSA